MKEKSAMKSRQLSSVVALCAVIAAFAMPFAAWAADPDWKAVEQALGKSGQMQPGDVFRIGMPRTDLSVTVKGVPVKAPFALYMHFWANDDPGKLARGLKAAIDLTNSARP